MAAVVCGAAALLRGGFHFVHVYLSLTAATAPCGARRHKHLKSKKPKGATMPTSSTPQSGMEEDNVRGIDVVCIIS